MAASWLRAPRGVRNSETPARTRSATNAARRSLALAPADLPTQDLHNRDGRVFRQMPLSATSCRTVRRAEMAMATRIRPNPGVSGRSELSNPCHDDIVAKVEVASSNLVYRSPAEPAPVAGSLRFRSDLSRGRPPPSQADSTLREPTRHRQVALVRMTPPARIHPQSARLGLAASPWRASLRSPRFERVRGRASARIAAPRRR